MVGERGGLLREKTEVFLMKRKIAETRYKAATSASKERMVSGSDGLSSSFILSSSFRTFFHFYILFLFPLSHSLEFICFFFILYFLFRSDFTLILWSPTDNKKPLARLTGHQQPVNQVRGGFGRGGVRRLISLCFLSFF